MAPRELTCAATDARAVIGQLEGELGLVQSVVCEGEEAAARLRGQLEELQEREETSQQQLAHAIRQVRRPHPLPHCLTDIVTVSLPLL